MLAAVRGLQTSQRRLNAKKNNEKHLEAEIKKLKALKDAHRDASFFEKIKLRSQLLEQEYRVTQAQEGLNGENNAPKVALPQDPLDPQSVKRYEAVFPFMLTSFLNECNSHANTSLNLNPNDIIEEIREAFKEEYPALDPVSKDEVLAYFRIYHDLLNNEVFLDELEFENPTITALLRKYMSIEPVDEADKHVTEVAAEMKLPEAVVAGWFENFMVLSSTPFAEGVQRMTNPICPAEYARYMEFASELDAVQEKLSKFYGKKDGVKGISFDKADKSSKNNNKKRPKNDKPSVDFEFNLSGNPVRLFQFGILGGLIIYLLLGVSQGNDQEITFQELTSSLLRKNRVARLVVVNNRTVRVELNDNGRAYSNGRSYYFNVGSVETFERNLNSVQDDFQVPDQLRVPVVFTTEGSTAKMVVNFLPTVLFLGAIYYMSKKAGMGGMGGPLNFGKSTAKKFNQEAEVKIRFKDVAGMSEAKEEVMEFVKFLQKPEKYEKLGAKIPRGAILSGPPGTGKTLIAKATAGEAGVPFYLVSGSEFVEMFVGVGASRVRDLFKTARENAPSIVFVDEIDAIGKQRSKGNASGANDERETTLNQLLVEMDGFESSDHVVVLAGTNRADILDKALMRPGRFDRHIAIDNPELQGRREIFEVHLKKITLAENIDKDLPGRLAALTPGFSGADIANVCNEAALIGARFNAEAVTLRHFELAIERVIGGVEKKTKILSPEEQRIVAYHEAGHAICGWYLRYAHPLLKVSIIPRGLGALGYAQYLPPDKYLLSTKELVDRMIMTLGGRVSEELNFASVTSGAHDDFKKVTNIAQSMVLRFGMSKKVGMVNYADTQQQDNLTKPFSDKTNRVVDEEVQRIVRECYQSCKALLIERAKEVELVAEELLKKEFITREDMIRLLGKRPFPETNDAFDKYLDGKAAFKNEKPPEEKKDGEK